MKKSSVLFAFLAMTFSGMSLAEEAPHEAPFAPYGYVGLGLQLASTDVNAGTAGNYSFDNSLAGLILGYRPHQNFGFEFRGYGSVTDDEIQGVAVETNQNIALLTRGVAPLGNYVELYGLLGFGNIEASAGGVSYNDQGLQYGVGVAFSNGGAKHWELQVEWMKLYDDSGLEVSGVNLNAVYKL